MTFDTTQLQANVSHYAQTAANYVQYGRDETLSFINQNLPNAVAEKVTLAANFINESLVAKNLESLGTTPSVASSAILGAVAGSLLVIGRPFSAIACLLPAVGLTKDTAEISVLGASFLTGAAATGCISLFGRAKIVSETV